MDLGLSGRRAIVTGGSKGLGQAIAAELLAEGAAVAICARQRGRARRDGRRAARARAGASPRCRATSPTLARSSSFMADAAAALGGIDILVNNAGAARPGPVRRR